MSGTVKNVRESEGARRDKGGQKDFPYVLSSQAHTRKSKGARERWRFHARQRCFPSCGRQEENAPILM